MSNLNHFKKYSSDFKLKVVLKYLSNNFTIAQICSEFQISKATLNNWVKQFKANSGAVFSDKIADNRTKRLQENKQQKELETLYKKIGQLTVERDFLKKVLDT